MRESCISRSPRARFVPLREEYVAALGSGAPAALLAVFEFWTNVRLSEREHAPRRQRADENALWVFRTRDELAADLLGVWGVRAVDGALKQLIESGLLERRRNPNRSQGYDRTFQYRLNLAAVQRLVTQAAPEQDGRCSAAVSKTPESVLESAAQHEQYRRTSEKNPDENQQQKERDLSLNGSRSDGPETLSRELAHPSELIAQYEAMSSDESYAPHLREMAQRRLEELQSRAASTEGVAA